MSSFSPVPLNKYLFNSEIRFLLSWQKSCLNLSNILNNLLKRLPLFLYIIKNTHTLVKFVLNIGKCEVKSIKKYERASRNHNSIMKLTLLLKPCKVENGEIHYELEKNNFEIIWFLHKNLTNFIALNFYPYTMNYLD